MGKWDGVVKWLAQDIIITNVLEGASQLESSFFCGWTTELNWDKIVAPDHWWPQDPSGQEISSEPSDRQIVCLFVEQEM